MRALNEKHVYYLTELTSEERKELWIYLTKVNELWAGDIEKIQFFECDYLYFCFDWVEKGEWLVSRALELIKCKKVTNAKELFYTLKNVQVDCRYLKREQVKEMAYVYKNNGFIIGSLSLCGGYYLLRDNGNNYCMVNQHELDKTTITYEKFMDLFGNKEEVKGLTNNLSYIDYVDKEITYKEKSEEFKNLVEVLNEELTEEAYKETSNKLNYELDFNFITQLAERMAQNKNKYEPYNWQKLDNIEDLKQALYRHVMEVMKGNYADDNRLFGHLESIALNSMFINYQLKKTQ